MTHHSLQIDSAPFWCKLPTLWPMLTLHLSVACWFLWYDLWPCPVPTGPTALPCCYAFWITLWPSFSPVCTVILHVTQEIFIHLHRVNEAWHNQSCFSPLFPLIGDHLKQHRVSQCQLEELDWNWVDPHLTSITFSLWLCFCVKLFQIKSKMSRVVFVLSQSAVLLLFLFK